jgi:nucleotide-binding universal stress UspA family protein
VWEKGNPAKKIISVAKKEKIDLLIAGALQRENVVKFYFGSIARKLIRKSTCSLLMLINPANPAKAFRRIVINGTEGR